MNSQEKQSLADKAYETAVSYELDMAAVRSAFFPPSRKPWAWLITRPSKPLTV